MHLVGFIIRIYHDMRSPERPNSFRSSSNAGRAVRSTTKVGKYCWI